MRKLIAVLALIVMGATLGASRSSAQTTYDSTHVVVNSGDLQTAVFTFANQLIQVQFRCGNNVWWYYTRPNTNSNFAAYGPFPMNGCQATPSSDGDIANDIVTEVVNAPLTAQASNGQTITVQFANFTSDKDGRVYNTLGGNSRITVQ